jgi:hypothetical protein
MSHDMQVQLRARRIVISCSCGWMRIMPRRSGAAVSAAQREHRDAVRESTPEHIRFQQMLAYIGATLV